MMYLQNILFPYIDCKREQLKLGANFPALVIDNFKAQRTEKMLKLLEEYHIRVVMVPSNCTDRLQPLDISVKVTMRWYCLSMHYWTSMVVTQECIPAGDPLSMRVPTFHSVHSPYCSSTYQTLSLGLTHSFLRLTNALLKYRYVCFHYSILLYIFLVFQVKHVQHLLFAVCTLNPCKPSVSFLFHCQWNHHDCTASIPIYCPFNKSIYKGIFMSRALKLVFWSPMCSATRRRV